jgi:hypothetical protein
MKNDQLQDTDVSDRQDVLNADPELYSVNGLSIATYIGDFFSCEEPAMEV